MSTENQPTIYGDNSTLNLMSLERQSILLIGYLILKGTV